VKDKTSSIPAMLQVLEVFLATQEAHTKSRAGRVNEEAFDTLVSWMRDIRSPAKNFLPDLSSGLCVKIDSDVVIQNPVDFFLGYRYGVRDSKEISPDE